MVRLHCGSGLAERVTGRSDSSVHIWMQLYNAIKLAYLHLAGSFSKSLAAAVPFYDLPPRRDYIVASCDPRPHRTGDWYLQAHMLSHYSVCVCASGASESFPPPNGWYSFYGPSFCASLVFISFYDHKLPTNGDFRQSNYAPCRMPFIQAKANYTHASRSSTRAELQHVAFCSRE